MQQERDRWLRRGWKSSFVPGQTSDHEGAAAGVRGGTAVLAASLFQVIMLDMHDHGVQVDDVSVMIWRLKGLCLICIAAYVRPGTTDEEFQHRLQGLSGIIRAFRWP